MKLLRSTHTFLWCCTRWFKVLSPWKKSLKCGHWNQSYWAVLSRLLIITLYKLVLTFQSVDQILKCDYSNDSYWAVVCSVHACYAVQGGSNFWVCRWNPKVWPFKSKLLSSTFLWCCLLCCTRWLKVLSPRKKSSSVATEIKATEQYFPVVLFIMLYKVAQSFESMEEILKCGHWNQSYWAVLSCLLIVLTFQSVDQILKCDFSNESYWTVPPSMHACYAVQGDSNIWVCGWNPKVWPF